MINLSEVKDAVAISCQSARLLNSPSAVMGGTLQQAEWVLGELLAVVRGRADGYTMDERLNALINGCKA
jgi:hypothetical protein